MKLILIILILLKQNLTTQDVILEYFKDADAIYANTKRFFYLIINNNKINAQKYCEILEDFNLKKLSLKDNFYLTKIFDVLKCDFDLTEIEQEATQFIKQDNFLLFYYSFEILTQNKKKIDQQLCKQIENFYNKEQKSIKLTQKDQEIQNHYYAALAMEMLSKCNKEVSENLRDEIIQNLIQQLEFVTKSTKAWINGKYTFYVTIKLFKEMIEHKQRYLSNEDFNYLMTYVEKYRPFNINYQEEYEFRIFNELLRKKKIQKIEVPQSLHLENCSEKCKLKIKNFLKDMEVFIKIENEFQKFQPNKKGEILIKKEIIQNEDQLQFKIEYSNRFYMVNNITYIEKENSVKVIRVKLSNNSDYSNLLNSDLNSCNQIYFRADQNNFIFVGIQPQHKKDLIFVKLKSTKQIEDSIQVLAQYDDKQELYIASFDLGDYYTILPNNDLYEIIIQFNGQIDKQEIIQCGRVEINFNTKDQYKRQKLTNAEQIQNIKHENKPLPKSRHIFFSIYFALLIVIITCLYFSLKSKLKINQISLSSKNIQLFVLFSLQIMVITYYGFNLNLMQNSLMIFICLIIFTIRLQKIL